MRYQLQTLDMDLYKEGLKMSEQTVSKSVHFIPQEIINEIEQYFCKQSRIEENKHPVFPKVEKVEFIRASQDRGSIWEEFKINDIILVHVLNGKAWTYITVEDDEKQKKAFGKRVKYVMQKTGVPWELAKLAVNRNPVDFFTSENRANADALNFIEDVKEASDNYRIFCKERMSVENYLRIHFSGCLSNKQICIIKEYWLSQNA